MTKTKTASKISVQATVNINEEDLESLLISGIEQGINYWCADIKVNRPPGDASDFYHKYFKVPFVEGGSICFFLQDPDDLNINQPEEGFRLDRQHILNGLNLMAARAPRHFADILSENTDCITGDVFIQICLFGEIVYG